jgi:hypothetical protein
VSCGGGRSIAPARRGTCSRVRATASADAASGIEAIGGLRQQIGDVPLQGIGIWRDLAVRNRPTEVDAQLGIVVAIGGGTASRRRSWRSSSP